ncbi:hypothetical protein, partial [Streptomyces sp. NPDC086776]
ITTIFMMFHSLHAGVVQITDIPSRPVHVTMTIAPPVLPDSAKAEAVSRREPADVKGIPAGRKAGSGADLDSGRGCQRVWDAFTGIVQMASGTL